MAPRLSQWKPPVTSAVSLGLGRGNGRPAEDWPARDGVGYRQGQMNTIVCSAIGFAKASSYLLWGTMMELKEAFGISLKGMRLRQRLTQEDFGDVSSRTYISMLERGLKNATIEKVAELAERLEIHPISLMVETFMILHPEVDLDSLIERIRNEVARHP